MIKGLLQGNRQARPLIVPIVFALGARIENLSYGRISTIPRKSLMPFDRFARNSERMAYRAISIHFSKRKRLAAGRSGTRRIRRAVFGGPNLRRRENCLPACDPLKRLPIVRV